MDFDSWDYEGTPSTSSMNLKFSRSDRGNPGFRMEIDDSDDEEESIYPCPYCSDDYGDAESLEYHIREAHPAKKDFHSELIKLKMANCFGKEFHYGSSRTNIGDSILGGASSNGIVDNLLAFICEVPTAKEIHNEQQLSTSSDLCIDAEELSGHKKAERAVASSPMSEEKAAEEKEVRTRCNFVQDLMFSALFDDVDL